MARRNNEEAVKQAELISRLNEWGNFLPFKEYMHWVFHVPNGGKRSKSSAAEMKAIGTKSGVHDLVCPWPTVYSGLFTVEMKAGKGTTSDKQDDFGDFMVAVGNKYLVTNCVDTAEREIIRYMLDSLKAPEFGIFEAIDCDHYYFSDKEVSEVGYELVEQHLFSGDESIQQRHAIQLKRKYNFEYEQVALRG